jgi:hypothetical protein
MASEPVHLLYAVDHDGRERLLGWTDELEQVLPGILQIGFVRGLAIAVHTSTWFQGKVGR